MHNIGVTKQNTAFRYYLKEGNEMNKQNLTTVLNSMKYINTDLMSTKKISAVTPLDTFKKHYEATQQCQSLISKSKRLAGN